MNSSHESELQKLTLSFSYLLSIIFAEHRFSINTSLSRIKPPLCLWSKGAFIPTTGIHRAFGCTLSNKVHHLAFNDSRRLSTKLIMKVIWEFSLSPPCVTKSHLFQDSSKSDLGPTTWQRFTYSVCRLNDLRLPCPQPIINRSLCLWYNRLKSCAGLLQPWQHRWRTFSTCHSHEIEPDRNSSYAASIYKPSES